MDDFDARVSISPEGDFGWGPNLSRDGNLVAYTNVSGGRSEIRVQPFPPTGEQWTISSGGGEEPIFLSTGNELVYRNGRQWMIVSFETEPAFSASAPRVLFEGPYINVGGFEYDVGPDDRFLLLRPISDAETTNRLNVVVNWFDELKRLAPTN